MEKKKIGEKVLLTRENGKLTIEINQKVPVLKLLIILLWFALVVIAGFMVIPDFMKLPSNWGFEKIFYSVLLAAWFFFLFKIGKLIIWRYIGREVIQFNAGEMRINNMYGTVGKPQKFNTKDIRNFKEYPRSNDLLKNYIDYEFLTTSGERFEFGYKKKEYIFGKMLNDTEIKILEVILRKEIRKK